MNDTDRILLQSKLQEGAGIARDLGQLLADSSELASTPIVQNSPAPAPEPEVPTATHAQSFETGQRVVSWALANVKAGSKDDSVVRIPFISDYSDYLSSLRLYWIYSQKAGYSAGTGGLMDIEVFSDTDSPLLIAKGRLKPDLGGRNQIGYSEKVTLEGLHKPVRGGNYYIQITNIDPRNDLNWISINCMAGSLSSLMPKDLDGNLRYRRVQRSYNGEPFGATWHQPIIDIGNVAGQHEGSGLFQGFALRPQFYTSGSDMIRQTVVLDYDNVVKNVNVAVARISGNDDLTMGIYDESGKLLASKSLGYKSFPTQSGDIPYEQDWVQFVIDGLLIPKNKKHYIRFSCPASSKYYIYGMQNAEAYGFDNRTMGWRGQDAQISTNSGKAWEGYRYSDKTKRKDGTLPVYFNKGYPREPNHFG